MNFDLANNTAVALSYKPTVTTAAANGTGVDLQGYKSATLVAFIGAEGDTLSSSVHFEISLEHSDDNSTFSDVNSRLLFLMLLGCPCATGSTRELLSMARGSAVSRVSLSHQAYSNNLLCSFFNSSNRATGSKRSYCSFKASLISWFTVFTSITR